MKMKRIIDEKDLREDYDLMFELQALRANNRNKLGYYAVSVKDEHGVCLSNC